MTGENFNSIPKFYTEQKYPNSTTELKTTLATSISPLECEFSAASLRGTAPVWKVGKIKKSRNVYM